MVYEKPCYIEYHGIGELHLGIMIGEEVWEVPNRWDNQTPKPQKPEPSNHPTSLANQMAWGRINEVDQ